MGKGQAWYKVAQNLAQQCLCSSVVWKVELSSNKIGFLSEEIAEQSFEGAAWFPPMAYSKMQEGNELKKEPECKDLENTQVTHTVKNEKVRSEKNTKGGTDRRFDKEISMV